MNLIETITIDSCMRLETIPKIKNQNTRKNKKIANAAKTTLSTQRIFTKRQLTELFFENCIDCRKMAAIPQGAFAVYKVRRNQEQAMMEAAVEGKEKTGKENVFNSKLLDSKLEGASWELTLLKYNSKLMNSIWGLYNRYSVHNFKKNSDAKEGAHSGVAAAIWGAILENHPPTANAAAAAAATATPETPRIMGTGNRL